MGPLLCFAVTCSVPGFCLSECLSSSSVTHPFFWWQYSFLKTQAFSCRLLLEETPVRHKPTVHIYGRYRPHAHLFLLEMLVGEWGFSTWFTGMFTFFPESAESRIEMRRRKNRNGKGETSFFLWTRQYILLLLKFEFNTRNSNSNFNPFSLLQFSSSRAPALISAPDFHPITYQYLASFSCESPSLY